MDADRLAAMSLDEFRRHYQLDDNAWWYLDSGHHQNLFDEATERLDEARAEVARLQAQNDAYALALREVNIDVARLQAETRRRGTGGG